MAIIFCIAYYYKIRIGIGIKIKISSIYYKLVSNSNNKNFISDLFRFINLPYRKINGEFELAIYKFKYRDYNSGYAS